KTSDALTVDPGMPGSGSRNSGELLGIRVALPGGRPDRIGQPEQHTTAAPVERNYHDGPRPPPGPPGAPAPPRSTLRATSSSSGRRGGAGAADILRCSRGACVVRPRAGGTRA